MLEIANDVAGPGNTCRPVQTWPGKEGRGTVRAYRAGDSYWLEWPGIARFTFTLGHATTRAMLWPGADRAVVTDVFERFVVPLVLHAGDEIRMTCDWQNTEDRPLAFPSEMCIGYGLYFPDRGADVDCVVFDRVQTAL